MKLEDQVVSLELAKRLKELGVRQEANFYWTKNLSREGFNFSTCRVDDDKWPCYAAFTVAELGEMLPHEANGFPLEIWKTGEGFGVRYFEEDYGGRETRFDHQFDVKEADARAKMLIHLIDKGIVKP